MKYSNIERIKKKRGFFENVKKNKTVTSTAVGGTVLYIFHTFSHYSHKRIMGRAWEINCVLKDWTNESCDHRTRRSNYSSRRIVLGRPETEEVSVKEAEIL